jgi:hypothetical protein
MSGKHNITKLQAESLYKMIKFFHDLCIKNNIAYWVTGGSLLGAIRHRGVIPWDDDGDVCIMRQDVPKLRKLIPYIKKHKYYIEEGTKDDEEKNGECVSKKNSCTWFMEPNSKHGLGLDIFIMDKVGPLITYADPYWRTANNGGKTCYFMYRFVFPLVPVRFGNFFVMTPYNSVSHLNSCYGADWNSMSQRLYDHREGKWVNSTKAIMGIDQYLTINPPKSTCSPNPPNVSCFKNKRIYSRPLKELPAKELRMIGKIMNIPNSGKLSVDSLRKALFKKL